MKEELNITTEWDKVFPLSNKELVVIPGATHTDLYDQKDKIPFDKIEKFLKDNFK